MTNELPPGTGRPTGPTFYLHKESGRHLPVSAVVLTDIQIPFWDLVMLLVRIALAAIPAAIIVGFVWMVLYAIMYATIGGAIYGALRH